jgi:hypothetical protein
MSRFINMADIVAYRPPKPAIKGIAAFGVVSRKGFIRIAMQ